MNDSISEQNAVEFSSIGSEKELHHIAQVIKFNQNVKLEIISGNEFPFFARLFHLQEKDGKNSIRLLAIDNGEIIVNKEEPIEAGMLDTQNLFQLFKETFSTDEISTQAWYDNLPCVGNGCCVFSEPAWTGGPLIPIPYNWCGANCGSGSPANSLDRCCRSHDYCYQSFSGYPDRCSCDQNLIDCVAAVGNASSLAIRIAFSIS